MHINLQSLRQRRNSISFRNLRVPRLLISSTFILVDITPTIPITCLNQQKQASVFVLRYYNFAEPGELPYDTHPSYMIMLSRAELQNPNMARQWQNKEEKKTLK
jgi:hypothetical protein